MSEPDEVTTSREPVPDSTADLLEETESLLSGEQRSGERHSGENAPSAGSNAVDRPSVDADDVASGTTRPTSWPRLSPSRYVSPKAFLVLLGLVSVGFLVGGALLPIAGRSAGMFVVAFLVGLLATRRRYLEVGAVGVVAGGVAAVFDYAPLAVAGSGEILIAIGVGLGLLTCLVGYYFGRDLRHGLSRDVD